MLFIITTEKTSTEKIIYQDLINILIFLELPHFRLAAVSQQRTAANCALSRRSPLLRDCDGAKKLISAISQYLYICLFLLLLFLQGFSR